MHADCDIGEHFGIRSTTASFNAAMELLKQITVDAKSYRHNNIGYFLRYID